MSARAIGRYCWRCRTCGCTAETTTRDAPRCHGGWTQCAPKMRRDWRAESVYVAAVK